MAKFKKGDKVIMTVDDRPIKKGSIGIVDENGSAWPWVAFSHGEEIVSERALELYKEPIMNRLKGMKLKFDVRDNPELSGAIQKRIFELGGEWFFPSTVRYTSKPYLYCYGGSLSYGASDALFVDHQNKSSTLDGLYHLPKTHTISIDGCGDIELSEESYQAFKAQFK